MSSTDSVGFSSLHLTISVRATRRPSPGDRRTENSQDSSPIPRMKGLQTNPISEPPSNPDDSTFNAPTKGQLSFCWGSYTKPFPLRHHSHQLPRFEAPSSYSYAVEGYHTLDGTLQHLDIYVVAWNTDQAMLLAVTSRGWLSREWMMARNPWSSGKVFSRAPCFHRIAVTDHALFDYHAVDGVLSLENGRDMVSCWD